MPFSRLVRMRSRTSAMSASRWWGFGSPWCRKSNDGASPPRAVHPEFRLDRGARRRSTAAGSDRVFALRSRPAEAALMHAVLVRADLVLEVVARAVDGHGHGGFRGKPRKRPENALRTLRLNDSRLRLIRREARRERPLEVGDRFAGLIGVCGRERGTAAHRLKDP